MLSQRAVFSCFVLCVIFLSASPVRADDPTPMEIFQNHTKAVGYSLSDGRAKPFIMTSTTSWYDYQNGRHLSKTTVKQAGSYYREDDTYSGSTNSFGFDGASFWDSSDNGILTADTGYSRPFDVTWAVINSEGFDASLPAELRKGSRTAYIVRIHPSAGVPADVYFDRSTWLIDQVIVDPDGDSIRQEYADYKAFGPVQVATTRRLNSTTTTVTNFSWDTAVTADALSAPSSANDTVVFPSSGTVTVPFDPHDGVIVDATINGVAGKFAVETLTPGILIDPVMAQHAHLVKSDVDARFADLNVGDLSGLPPATIRVGGLTLKNCTMRLYTNNFDLRQQPFDGYLGLDLLAKAVTSIDFDSNMITFTDPAVYSPPKNEVTLPIALDRGVPQIIARVNGSKNVSMQLGLSLQGRAIFWQAFLKPNPDIAYQAGGFGGTMRSLSIGPYEQDTVSAASIPFASGETYETGANGILGYGVLNAFNLILDYPDSKLFIKPTKRTAP